MAVETLKSASLTVRDATPPGRNSQGEGGKASARQVNDFVTIPASASIGSTFRICRLPADVKVKEIILESDAQAAGAMDVGLYYSASVNDSPQAANKAGAVIDADFFASAVSLAAASKADITNESGTYTLALRNTELWSAVGLSSDPGGFFDVVGTVTTAVTTGTGKTGLSITYTD